MSTASMHTEDHILEYAGSFRLVRKIAQGGMATVYEAEQLGPAGFAKRVALKVIHPHYAKEKTWLQLFIDEAKLSANLVHGNIVQIYQLGEVDGQYYMAMEYIKGPTLRAHHRAPSRARDAGAARDLRVHREPRVPRARLRPQLRRPRGRSARHRPPRRVAQQHHGHVGRSRQARRLRYREGDHIDRSDAEVAADADGQEALHEPRAAARARRDGRSDVFAVGVVLYELLALEPLFYEDATELLIDEVTWRPLPERARARPRHPARDRGDPHRLARPRSDASVPRPRRWDARSTNGANRRPSWPRRIGSRSIWPRSSPRATAAHGERRAHALLELQARASPRRRPAPQLVVQDVQAGVIANRDIFLSHEDLHEDG